MKKVKWLFLISFLFVGICLSALQAQTKITGKISDENGAPLPGVTVVFKGTTNGTISDIDGKYVLNSTDVKSLIIYSFIGMASQEIDPAGRTVIDVVMKAESLGLDEVVAVGYGVQKKSDLTGSVVSVKSEEIVKVPVTRVDQALQGRVAGVNISNDKAQPGSAPVIRIRGDNSLSGDNSPLVVIDGILGGDISMLSPNEVASVEILKDASATAIYGSRGANGVIIVTTKSGATGKTKFEFGSYGSISMVANQLELLNAEQQVGLLEDVSETSGWYEDAQELISLYKEGQSTNWQDEIFHKAYTQSYSLNISGGSEKTKFALSGSIFDQDGIVKKTGFDRQTLRFKLDNKVNEKLDIGVIMFMGRSTQNNTRTDTPGGSSGGSATQAANRFSPILSVYDENGDYTSAFPENAQLNNPSALINERIDEKNSFSTTANMYLNYKITNHLTFKPSFTYRYSNTNYNFWAGKSLLEAQGIGKAKIRHYINNYWLSENTLTYDNTFGEHHITVMGGITASQTETTKSEGTSINFPTEALQYHSLELGSPDGQTVSSGLSESSMASYLGRFNYVLASKYLFTFNFRADASSKFATNNKWSYFPSAALGWRVIEEDFMQNQTAVSNLKARLSYGQVGSQAILPYQSLASYNNVTVPLGSGFYNGITSDRVPNPDLRWEITEQINAGIDLGLFNNRISIVADYYVKTTKDLHYLKNLPYYTGYAEQTQNIGSVENKGFELGLSTVNLEGAFKWFTDFNISFNKNTVLDLGADEFQLYDASGGALGDEYSETAILQVGESMGSFYGYQYDGIYQNQSECDALPYPIGACEPGMIKLRDIAGAFDEDGNPIPDGQITPDDRTIIGNGLPDFTFGFSNDFAYKNFDLNIMFQGSYGNDVFNMNRVKLERVGLENGLASLLTESWNGEGSSNTIQSIEKGVGPASSRFVEDGSYLRLKNLSIGYTLPTSLTNRWGINKLRFYASGQNLFTITDYKGYDPEVNSRGYDAENLSSGGNVMRGFDYGGYPTAKTFTFGLDVSF